MRLRYLFTLIFIILATTVIHGQLSTKHYIPPITTGSDAVPADNIGAQFIYVSTPRTDNVSFTITPVGQPASAIVSGTVSNNTPFVYQLPLQGNNSQLHLPPQNSSQVVTNKGFIIDAQDVVYVSVRFRQAGSQFHAGALVSKGLSALGTDFRMGGFVTQNAPVNGYQNFISVMATEDDTNVTVDLPAGINLPNGTVTTGPVNVVLDESETYMVAINVQSGGNPNDLIGTQVTSDKPIVANSGSATSTFGPGQGRDYGIDQIVDASRVGTEYIFVRGDGTTGVGGDAWENILIIATENNTQVFVNDNPSPEILLQAGQWVVIEGDGIGNNGNGYSPDDNLYVRTNNPVFAYQGIGGTNQSNTGNNEANQGMFFVPPLSCENRGNVDNIAAIDQIGSVTFNGGITIVTNRGATVTVRENGVERAIDAITEGPFDVRGNDDYVTYKLLGLQNNVSVESSGELYCAYFNRDTGAAASGSFYSGFPSPPEISFETNIASLGNCIPNVTLESLNTDLFDSVEWFFDDGSGAGFVSTGNITGTIVPSQAGNYQLVGTLVCSGSTFASQSIPVSLCPDDLDNDLIIDNLDIDLDNDGILNCDESRGNVNLDFTDINQPVLNFLDGGTDNTFLTTTLTSNGTTTLTGDATSNLVSTISPGGISDQLYSLTFNEAANIEFTQSSGTTHTIVAGESFVLSVGPNTKNITLVDPDDQLLIDTDFDGIYETGVTDYSSSEVRFRFNPTPDGPTPFRLVANNVIGVSFQHIFDSTIETSTIEVNLILTCFGLDSDGDGIVNSLDADSDNDGIPDLIEIHGSDFMLSGDDDNLDGLDDIFDTNPVPNVDTDGDGILDILDLDSDNDGVYDIFETGFNLLDADLDGRVDNAAAIVGMNGLVDVLETTPDSFELVNPVGDPDGDTIFSYRDLDSDGDNCPDVIEAGFTDPDGDDIIGTSPVTVDAEGRVTGIPDGYTFPNSDYNTNAPIDINTPFEDVAFCETSTATITLDSTADTFQWELSTDNGANWVTLTDDATYSGSTTTSLTITNLSLSLQGYQYRVQLQRAGNSCDGTSNAVTLTVEPLPIVNPVAVLRQCDNDTDGFSAFNLNEAASDISANFMNETFVFYPTQTDAENDTNAFTAAEALAYTNQTVTTDTVWARAISTFGCFQVARVDLIVSTTGLPTTFARSFTVCDDFLDINGDDNANNDDTDGVSMFDFSGVTAEVRALFPPTQQLTITYYRNEADALAESNAIADPSNYRNIGYPNTQQIYIRVDSDLDNDCLGFGPFITLNVDPVPTATPVGNLELCDNLDDGDGFNGIVQTFNLDAQTPIILGSQDPNDYTVTYHTSAADALSGANPIANTTAYTNITPNLQTVYVRVTNNIAGCFTNHTSFDLIVNELPVANFVEDLEICDDDSDGSARNGFSQSFNLELQTPGILGGQDPNQFTVTYHASLANAQAGISPLGSPFSNSVAFTQTIYVRVSNGNTGCANGISNFNVIVNPEPITEEVSNLSYCDDDLDGDDTNGFVQNIDLDSQIPGILGPTQDEDDFTVTFHETQADASSGMNPLTSPYANTTANQQTIYVRVMNDDTGCVNDDFTFEVIVNPLPDFSVISPQIVCLNGPPLTISADNPGAVYDFVWTDPTGNNIIGQQITITSGGLYTVTATTTDGTACTRTREIQVDESIIATITDDDVTIVDDSENNSITIDPTNLGIGDYEYALADEDDIIVRTYQDDPLFENLEGGFYTILVRDKNGCGVASLLVSVVEFPKFFTPNNDGIKDTWAIKGANSVFFPTAEINIFNRFGKVVAQIDIDAVGWDGTFNGKTLPSDDYWFNIRLVDRNGIIRERQGNFSLLRR